MIKGQVHSKFKVFIPASGVPYADAMSQLSAKVEEFTSHDNVAAKSVGVEYMEGTKQLILSVGYRDDEPGYKAKLVSISLGTHIRLEPELIEAAMTKAAEGVENVICHEFFVTDEGEFVMV